MSTSTVLKRIILLVFFSQIIYIIGAFSPTVNIHDALICDSGTGHRNYVVPDVIPCTRSLTEKSSTCQANVYNVDLARIPLRAYFCSLKIETFTSKMFFWGEQSFTKDSTKYYSPSFQTCTAMFRNKFHPQFGELEQSTPQLWNTNRKIAPRYVWLQTLNLINTNAFLKATQVYYNVVTRKVMTNLENTDHCKFDSGFCTTPTKIIVWEPNNTDICQFIKSAKIHEAHANLHFAKNQTLTRIDIPTITSSFTQFHKLDKHIIGCFVNPRDKLFQTYEGFILQLQGCSKRIKNYSHLKDKFLTSQYGNVSIQVRANKISAEFNYLFNIQRKTLMQMEAELNFLECKQNNLIRKHMKLLSRLYPSSILSEILGRPVGATVTNDILTEKSCSTHNLTLIPTLWLNEDTFSTKPLATLTAHNKTTTLQLLEENIWSADMNFLTKTAVSGYLSFSIGGRVFSYLNGTLLQSPVKVTMIGIKPPKLDLQYKNEDFTLSGVLLDKPLQSDSMLAMEIALKNLQFERQMQNYQSGKQLWVETSALNTPISPAGKIIRSGSGLDFLRGLISIISFLSQFWGTLLTAGATYFVVRSCCGKHEKKHIKPYQATAGPDHIIFRDNITNKRTKAQLKSNKI